MDPLSLLRRSRNHHHHNRAPGPVAQPAVQLDIQPILAAVENASEIDPNYRRGIDGSAMERRMTPDELKAIQASMSQSVANAVASASAAKAAGDATSQRVGANAATIGTTISRLDQTQAVGAAATIVQTSTTRISAAAATPVTSTVTTSSTVRSSTTSSSSSPTTRSTTSSLTPSTTSTQGVLTITSNRSTSSSSSLTSSSSATPSASIAAAGETSATKSLSTGSIVGIALAVVVGLVVLGSAAGWLYRKYAARSYSTTPPWSKLDDNDVTPFHSGQTEKPLQPSDGDVYGHPAAPVIGSRRALTMARQNAFNPDGTPRPDSDYMIQREGNRAGLGAGALLGQYSAYPDLPPTGYGYDAQGRPYNVQSGRVPMAYSQGYPDQYEQPGSASRQLLGHTGGPQKPYPYSDANAMPNSSLMPMPMGKPSAPTTSTDIADLEEFADLPDSQTGFRGNNNSTYSTYGLAYADSEPEYTPRTATTMGEWAGDARPQAPALPQKAALSSPDGLPTPLPALVPISPLMSSFGGLERRQSAQPPLGPLAASFANKYGSNASAGASTGLYADEDERSRQKRMYSEGSQVAGFPEPPTPHSLNNDLNLNASTNSATTAETTSSFSAHGDQKESMPMPTFVSNNQRLPPPPTLDLRPPQPYQHGQPLSPLPEVATPASTFSGVALSSSSLNHGQIQGNEINPFDRLAGGRAPGSSTLLTPKRYSGGLLPPAPYSAATTTGATTFPSPRYPPPSPGGMSVPGSVTDSPMTRGRRMSYDEEDAYGGI